MKYFLFIQTNSDIRKNGDQNVFTYNLIAKEKMPMIFSNYLYELNFKQYERIKNFQKTGAITKSDFFIANQIEELLI